MTALSLRATRSARLFRSVATPAATLVCFARRSLAVRNDTHYSGYGFAPPSILCSAGVPSPTDPRGGYLT